MDLCGVDVSLYDVQDAHINSVFKVGGDHDVLSLQESPHDIEHSGLPDRADMSVQSQRRVAGHQEVAAGRGDEGGHEADQVVVHVPRVPQGGRAGGHDGRDQRVGLGEAGVRDLEPVDCDVVQRRVVQDDHTVSVQRQALKGQQAVVRLHDHVCLLLVREN